jgi:hypothetical protein
MTFSRERTITAEGEEDAEFELVRGGETLLVETRFVWRASPETNAFTSGGPTHTPEFLQGVLRDLGALRGEVK